MSADVEKLESHLRDEVESLTGAGLDSDEAFLVAVKRVGALDAVSREFAREHAERLWKQLVFAGPTIDGSTVGARAEGFVAVAVGLALAAAIAFKIPAFFGYAPGGGSEGFYARNFSLFVLPALVAFLAWKGWCAATIAVLVDSMSLAPEDAGDSANGRASRGGYSAALIESTWIVLVLASSVPMTVTFCAAKASGVFWSLSTYRFSPSSSTYAEPWARMQILVHSASVGPMRMLA